MEKLDLTKLLKRYPFWAYVLYIYASLIILFQIYGPTNLKNGIFLVGHEAIFLVGTGVLYYYRRYKSKSLDVVIQILVAWLFSAIITLFRVAIDPGVFEIVAIDTGLLLLYYLPLGFYAGMLVVLIYYLTTKEDIPQDGC